MTSGLPNPTSAMGDHELGLAIIEILRHPLYQTAREAIITVEVLEREAFPSALAELRDVLDHLILACKPNITESEHQMQVGSAWEHLRRAAVEPLELATESQLVDLLDARNRYWVVTLLFPGLPTIGYVDQEISQIRDLLIKGRQAKGSLKTAEESITYFSQALGAAVRLRSSMRPSRWHVLTRFGVIALSLLLMLGIGFLASWLAMRTGN